jgi:ankyrin repeat protein
VAIAEGDRSRAGQALRETRGLTAAAIERDAPRTDPAPQVLQQLSCYLYKGDTALHVAAAAHRPAIASLLLNLGADVGARNRRGTTALHHAAAGAPESPRYDPEAQVETLGVLLAAGADPEAVNKDGATPLHRAIRSRCSVAVATLLEAGASPVRPNGNGSSPLHLATHATGRGGSGAPAAKREQAEIIRLLTDSASR